MKLHQLKESRDQMLPSYQQVRKAGVAYINHNLGGNSPTPENVAPIADQFLALPRNNFLTDKLKTSLKNDLIDAFLL